MHMKIPDTRKLKDYELGRKTRTREKEIRTEGRGTRKKD